MIKGFFTFWQKSMEAFQQNMDACLAQPLAQPPEFSVRYADPKTSDPVPPKAVSIFVEGEWLSLEQFIARFKTMRDNEE